MKKTVLIVDDDMDFLRLAQVWLRAAGFDVVSAVDGISAVSTARKSVPDLVIMDVGLPAGGGITALERIKHLAPVAGVPILVVTGGDPGNARVRAGRAGANGFITKQAGRDEIVAVVRQLLDDGEASLAEPNAH